MDVGIGRKVGVAAGSVRRVGRSALLGAVVGVLSGVGSAAFLRALDWATRTRLRHGWLLWMLPLGGVVIGAGFHRFGGRAAGGTNLVLDTVHAVEAPTDAAGSATDRSDGYSVAPVIPATMAPLVLVGSTATHLVGGSGGREGAAVQIAASLTDGFLRLIGHRDASERRLILRAAIAGGFGSVFGTPIAGAVFGLEIPTRVSLRGVRWGRLDLKIRRLESATGQTSRRAVQRSQRIHALVPVITAAFVGDRVTRLLGIHHGDPADLATFPMTPPLLVRVALAGVAFGLAARGFVALTGSIRDAGRRVGPEIRLAIGGAIVLAISLALHTRAYNGLSLPLINTALNGVHVVALAWLWKLVLTSITVGSGFPGGEVTPLFCVGACLGSVLSGPLGGSAVLLAALGYVAVFGAAANAPITFTVLGAELFGTSSILLFALANLAAFLSSGLASVYHRPHRPPDMSAKADMS